MPQLGDVYINNVYDEKPQRSVKTTDHPIEGGDNITDHTEREPDSMSISGVVVGLSAANRLNRLDQYMKNSELLTYVYRNLKKNVIIKSFESTHDAEVANGFKFSMTLKEIRVAKPSIVKSLDKDKRTQAAELENKGQQQATGGSTKVYIVKSGDTLSGIGSKFGVNYTKIHDRNRGTIGSDPSAIYPGQKLIIPVSGSTSSSGGGSQAQSITGDTITPNNDTAVMQ